MVRMVKMVLMQFFLLVLPVFVFAGPVPDTGQTKCYDNNGEISCPQLGEAFYGQDANYNINLPSYTKLGQNGTPLSDTTTQADGWIMTRDNVNGLIWEIKTDDGSINDTDSKYTWSYAQSWFITQLNQQGFAGFSDWRLPTIKELSSLINNGIAYPGPTIDTAWFPHTTTSVYWSSTASAYGTSFVWWGEFHGGWVRYHYKSDNGYVRAVRAGQSDIAAAALVDNGDGSTVTDTEAGLMWQKATTPGTYTWQEALEYAEGLTLGGYSDWRLPNRNELQALVDYSRYPVIDPLLQENTVSDYYWSSTTNTYKNNTNHAHYVNFDVGYNYIHAKSNSNSVRSVRGGQNQISGHLVISSPSQASSWDIGGLMSITWETQGIAENVKISISREGGKAGTFETIIESTENDGGYEWTVTGTESVNCMLKIEPINDPSKGTTQGLFTIIVEPIANFSASSTAGQPPLTVNFTDESTGDITEWLWDFGDGETGAEQNPSHTYQNDGTYTVSLTVTGPGGSDTETKTGYINITDSATDSTLVSDFVTRFYQQCLGRNPDQAGLNGWVNALIDGSLSGSDVANGFIFSQEFIDRNTSNAEFITILYRAFFNRAPDSVGYNGWLSALNVGLSRQDALNGFIYSAEFENLCASYGINPYPGATNASELVEDFVTRFYQQCLNREPDQAGLDGWVNALTNGSLTGADVANGFIFSPEFVARNTTNAEFLIILYEAFFDRLPDVGGYNGWLDAMNQGLSREDVLTGFLYSLEFYNLCDLYGITAN